MREGYAIGAQAKMASGLYVNGIDHNPTVEENIDIKIKQHEAEIERLKKSKHDLGPLLKMRISDIRQAMEY